VADPKHLVLLGGGHAHVAVLRALWNQPWPSGRVTLVSRLPHTPYSGMIPGLLAGHYHFDETHLDLTRLCQRAKVDFVHATVERLDLVDKELLCTNGERIRFDGLSINTGSTPSIAQVPGAENHAIPVKPIDRFLDRWQDILARAATPQCAQLRVVVVGGGAAGVELALSTQYRLQRVFEAHGKPASAVEFTLVSAGLTLLASHNLQVQHRVQRLLRDRRIRVECGRKVVSVGADSLQPEGCQPIGFDVALWATHASAPAWIQRSGLRTDADGFVAVNECLQSLSHSFVFAAGDVASMVFNPRPKSGVFAVRQGGPLTRNLFGTMAGTRLIAYHPQEQFLCLISTGDRRAIASKGSWSLEGRVLWWLKNWIDRRWMNQYRCP